MKCFHPQTIKDNIVSCGRCPACKKNRINGWVCRLERHARHQDSAYFITLTYADGQATTVRSQKNDGKDYDQLTLNYDHIQHFLKSLRNITNAEYKKRKLCARKLTKRDGQERSVIRPKKFSYYVAGEYGTKNKISPRPHYHLIMFNAKLEFIYRAWCTGDHYRRVPRGNVHSGTLSGGSIRYTLKYISKPSRLPLFQGDKRTPEFSHMSKGIGKDYINEKIIKWHKADLLNRYYVPNAGGVQTTMPRYYADKIYTLAEKIQIAEHLEKKSSDLILHHLQKDDHILRCILQFQNKMENDAFLQKNYRL